MTNPGDDDAFHEALEGDLRSVTDDEWREGHEALAASGSVPPEELEYVWDPDLDPQTLIDPGEEEFAPNG